MTGVAPKLHRGATAIEPFERFMPRTLAQEMVERVLPEGGRVAQEALKADPAALLGRLQAVQPEMFAKAEKEALRQGIDLPAELARADPLGGYLSFGVPFTDISTGPLLTSPGAHKFFGGMGQSVRGLPGIKQAAALFDPHGMESTNPTIAALGREVYGPSKETLDAEARAHGLGLMRMADEAGILNDPATQANIIESIERGGGVLLKPGSLDIAEKVTGFHKKQLGEMQHLGINIKEFHEQIPGEAYYKDINFNPRRAHSEYLKELDRTGGAGARKAFEAAHESMKGREKILRNLRSGTVNELVHDPVVSTAARTAADDAAAAQPADTRVSGSYFESLP